MTRVLLDTQLLLWAHGDRRRLGRALVSLLERADVEVFFSAVSIWEIAIKAGLRRTDFTADPTRIFETSLVAGFIEVPVTSATARLVADLPLHHRDPFDRLLVAQAIAAPARLYTSDRRLAPYSELVAVVG